jgi:hypothetical protein
MSFKLSRKPIRIGASRVLTLPYAWCAYPTQASSTGFDMNSLMNMLMPIMMMAMMMGMVSGVLR